MRFLFVLSVYLITMTLVVLVTAGLFTLFAWLLGMFLSTSIAYFISLLVTFIIIVSLIQAISYIQNH